MLPVSRTARGINLDMPTVAVILHEASATDDAKSIKAGSGIKVVYCNASYDAETTQFQGFRA
jgi:hypothetical protein